MSAMVFNIWGAENIVLPKAVDKEIPRCFWVSICDRINCPDSCEVSYVDLPRTNSNDWSIYLVQAMHIDRSSALKPVIEEHEFGPFRVPRSW